MRYWWVNQKQTHRHELGDGYLWSPKRRANQTRSGSLVADHGHRLALAREIRH
jgi:hypothetical protein